jgi:hypothetical protein
MSHVLFAQAEILQLAEGWLENWMPAIGGSGLCAIVVLSMTYFFLWFFAERAKKAGWKKVKMPLGIYFETDDTADHANADAAIVEGIYETGQQLEYRAKVKMRKIMDSVVNKYMAQYHKPYLQEFILRARMPLSVAISDNHIVYSITDDGVLYVQTKQQQTIDGVSVYATKLSEAEKHEIIEILKTLTTEFFLQICSTQRWLCTQKIEAYETALAKLQMDGARARCQAKINKNEKYLRALCELTKDSDNPLASQITQRNSAHPITGHM